MRTTAQYLQQKDFFDALTTEFGQIPLPAPKPSELVAADLLVNAIFSAQLKAVPQPGALLPLQAALPRPARATDPEFTSTLRVSQQNDIKAYATTEVVRQFKFEPDMPAIKKEKDTTDTSQSPQSSLVIENYVRARRPPSQTDVRSLSKTLESFQQEKLKKFDAESLKADRLLKMKQALAGEAKQGRKLEALPDNMKYVVGDNGEVVGVGTLQAKQLVESVVGDVRPKEAPKKKDDKVVEKEVEKGMDEVNKRVVESLLKGKKEEPKEKKDDKKRGQ